MAKSYVIGVLSSRNSRFVRRELAVSMARKKRPDRPWFSQWVKSVVTRYFKDRLALATAIGIEKSTLSCWQSGRRGVDVEAILANLKGPPLESFKAMLAENEKALENSTAPQHQKSQEPLPVRDSPPVKSDPSKLYDHVHWLWQSWHLDSNGQKAVDLLGESVEFLSLQSLEDLDLNLLSVVGNWCEDCSKELTYAVKELKDSEQWTERELCRLRALLLQSTEHQTGLLLDLKRRESALTKLAEEIRGRQALLDRLHGSVLAPYRSISQSYYDFQRSKVAAAAARGGPSVT